MTEVAKFTHSINKIEIAERFRSELKLSESFRHCQSHRGGEKLLQPPQTRQVNSLHWSPKNPPTAFSNHSFKLWKRLEAQLLSTIGQSRRAEMLRCLENPSKALECALSCKRSRLVSDKKTTRSTAVAIRGFTFYRRVFALRPPKRAMKAKQWKKTLRV